MNEGETRQVSSHVFVLSSQYPKWPINGHWQADVNAKITNENDFIDEEIALRVNF